MQISHQQFLKSFKTLDCFVDTDVVWTNLNASDWPLHECI